MTSAQIRQSFLDFFKSKGHTIVPSASLMPDSPNLLFTNAGMNQFVPIFLGQRAPDVTKWAGAIPASDTRAADTQKCIRAGGKHNDLEDVGLDTYHHTFFEMLGNWSFGDYFKKEAIEWAWELITEVWKFPKDRLYATVYSPHKAQGDPSDFDQEAYDAWAGKFRVAGLDPKVHIINGDKKDNFWMMGDTGPCGPCSELHVDLTPNGDTQGSLVNKGDARCIEIWNLVFIQFNANPDGSFSPLPARHVDTGMGFERVTGIIQNTRGFTDFTRTISNYETDIFRPLFDKLEHLSGKKYHSVTTPTLRPYTTQGPVALRPTTNPELLALLSKMRKDRQAGRSPNSDDLKRYCELTGLNQPYRPSEPRPPAGGGEGMPEMPAMAMKEGVVAPPKKDLPPADATEDQIKAWVENLLPPAEGLHSGSLDQRQGYIDGVTRIIHGLPPDQREAAYEQVIRDSKQFHEQIAHKMDRLYAPREQAEAKASIQADIAFRVIADHIRTLSFAIADGIQPGNTDRNYVLRRILRRAVRYGRTLGFHEPFFYKLVSVLVDTMGHVFPELRAKQDHIEQVIQWEEEAFNKTLDRGIELFESELQLSGGPLVPGVISTQTSRLEVSLDGRTSEVPGVFQRRTAEGKLERGVTGAFAFKLYDTYGFPLDLTELMARERGLTVDVAGFNKLMEEQKARARAAQKKQVIELSQVETTTPTQFVGYDKLEAPAKVLDVANVKHKTGVILDTSPFYAEMGGQVGDTGRLSFGGSGVDIVATQKIGDTVVHILTEVKSLDRGTKVNATVDRPRREAIQRHHTVTHLLHWALHEVVSPDATQKGSYVGPEKLTFDFSSAPLTPQQLTDVERLVNERILENAPVTWTEAKYGDIKSRKDIMQFFGEKYGDVVRVVQIGGKPAALDGYSMELCGGTHTRATGEIGLFRIAAESAIAAGIRRIEAVSGLEAYKRANEELQLIKTLSGKVNSPVGELEKKIESLLAQQKDLEKQLKAMQQKQAGEIARSLAAKAQTIGTTPAIIENLGAADGDFLQSIADALKGQFKGVVVLGGTANSAVALVATVSPDLTKKLQAGKIIQGIAPVVGGKGGGRPDNARGGGKDVSKLDEALAKAKALLG
jgi:alanyl-tRNA synthetase